MIDIEAVVIAWLEDTIEDVRASTETPPDLDDQLPWLQVVRIGGPYDGFRIDRPGVDIDTFAADGPTAAALALQVQQLLHDQLARSTTGMTVFSHVETVTGPHWLPYDNPRMRRYGSSYRFAIHPA